MDANETKEPQRGGQQERDLTKREMEKKWGILTWEGGKRLGKEREMSNK